MDLFKRNRLAANFPNIPREPSGRELVDEASIVELDEQIYRAQRLGRGADRDRLLDLRLAIRPPRVVEATPLPRRTT